MSKKQYELSNKTSLLKMLPTEVVSEIQQGLYEGRPLVGKDGLLNSMIKELLELSLQGEIDSHLNQSILEEGSNRRNGISTKTVKSSVGSFDLDVPRDRNSTFEPEIVKKRQTVLNDELDSKILFLYALGNSYDDISRHISEIYGLAISDAKISSITDRLIPQLTAWRNRPLLNRYAIVFLDAMFFKVKQDNKVSTKVIYNIMGIDMSGRKDILGFYACESEGAFLAWSIK